MARVETWFREFVQSIVQRIPRDNWPMGASEYWDTLRGSFVRHGVTKEVAHEALSQLAEAPPKFLDQLLPDLLKKIREVRAAVDVPANVPSDRDAAQLRSRDCDDCGGKTGLATRFRRLTANATNPDGKPSGDHILLYCRCPLGRWAESNHRRHAEDVRRRILDLEDHPWLWGLEYRHPPGIAALDAAHPPAESPAPF